MIETRSGSFAAAGQPSGMNQDACLDPQILRHSPQSGADSFVLKRLKPGEGLAQFGQARFVLRGELLLRRLWIIRDVILEIKSRVSRQFAEQLELAFARVQGGSDVGNRIFIGVQ